MNDDFIEIVLKTLTPLHPNESKKSLIIDRCAKGDRTQYTQILQVRSPFYKRDRFL